MALSVGRPSKRLRTKQSVPQPLQAVLLEPPVLGEEGTAETKRSVYLVTFPHPRQGTSIDGVLLVAPESMSKRQVMECFKDACARPVYTHVAARAEGFEGAVRLRRAGLWRELHKEDQSGTAHAHDHVAALASSFRFLPVKRALLMRHGLATHWSCTHQGYHSTVRYCVMASPKKPAHCLDVDPVLWAADGAHPPVEECCYEPITAAALQDG